MVKAGTKQSAAATRSRSKGASGSAKSPTARKTKRGSTKAKSSKRRGGYSPAREVFSVVMGCFGIIFGIGVVGLCLAGWYACNLATSVLQEIGERDFAGAYARIGNYENFLESLDETDYIVNQGKTNITEGRERHTWVVQLRGSSEVRRFQWIHDYKENEVYPLTNPALCLDIELGNLTVAEAEGIELAANEGYNPDDVITGAMVKNNFSMIQAQDMVGGEGWDPSTGQENTVGSPRLSPAEAAKREGDSYQAVVEQEGEQEDEQEDDIAEESSVTELGNSTDVTGLPEDAPGAEIVAGN